MSAGPYAADPTIVFVAGVDTVHDLVSEGSAEIVFLDDVTVLSRPH